MRWPWEFLMKTKGNSNEVNREVTVPAQDEIKRTQDRIDRVNRILVEAHSAERVVFQLNERR